MKDGKPPSIQEQLAAIQMHFIQSLAGRREDIEGAFRELQAQWSNDVAGFFHRSIHNLAGSAGSFGLSEIGEAASELDRHLKRLNWPALNGIPHSEFNEIQAQLQTLVELINKSAVE